VPIKQNGTKLVFGFPQHDAIAETISGILRRQWNDEDRSEISYPSTGLRVNCVNIAYPFT
jgi:hypothetical protein